ncbi:MAG TPA: flagellar motor protein MotB [Mariprofundaceae bacterium]|nr:flagellar motor protein MotB [Mariprofundaceae bacterium]
MSSPDPFIVKKTRKVIGDGGHHGGSWKIAYADFVTAMMAFFLLMWLTIAAGKKSLQGISEYFRTPLTVAMEGGKSSGDRTSIMKGGGTDITRTEGQVRKGEVKHQRRIDDKAAANKAKADREKVIHLEGLKVELQSAVKHDKFLQQFKNQLRVDTTSEGLRIQVVDKQNRPLFTSGSARLQPYAKKLLKRIGHALNMVPNKISISGHTDAKPFAGRSGYSNWDLSADRANACRREMVAGGMEPDKVLRVVGQASAVPLDPKHPLSAINRRISIIVLNDRAERNIAKMSSTINLNSGGVSASPSPQHRDAAPLPSAQPAPKTPDSPPQSTATDLSESPKPSQHADSNKPAKRIIPLPPIHVLPPPPKD